MQLSIEAPVAIVAVLAALVGLSLCLGRAIFIRGKHGKSELDIRAPLDENIDGTGDS